MVLQHIARFFENFENFGLKKTIYEFQLFIFGGHFWKIRERTVNAASFGTFYLYFTLNLHFW